ncbi:MAG: asparagine synthase-related protein [Anaerolineaceae bacterium]|jgi:hypothetical protein|nr:asparagine synthase-related protein [Anaerolineaceae bacterium]
MAGFAALFNKNSSPQSRLENFNELLMLTCRFKEIPLPDTYAIGQHCIAAKIDAISSLHLGIVRDENSGSWIFATGTVVALEGANDSNTLLVELLRGYLEVGEKILEKYDGHFALVIYDGYANKLDVFSDPTGQFSIFYAIKNDQHLISTSAFALAKMSEAQPDDLIIENYLRTGKILGGQTIWRGVNRIPPATILRLDAHGMNQSEYWMPRIVEKIADLPIKQALEHADIILQKYFSLILEREGKVWADLTGGMDSRLTTMFMAKLKIPFTAYCVGTEDNPDVRISRIISREMGWEYENFTLPDNWAQLQLDWMLTALQKGDACLSISELAPVLYGQSERAKKYNVSVTGLGGDEWREPAFNSTNLFNWGKNYEFDRVIDAKILNPIPINAISKDREDLIREEWRSYLAKIILPYDNYPNFIKSNIMFIKFRYPSHGGAYLSAAAGISRSISPFCFKELINFGLSLKFLWRLPLHHHFIRKLFERENYDLANIELTKGGPAIPIRLNNLNAFRPLFEPIIQRRMAKIKQKLLHQSKERIEFIHPTGSPSAVAGRKALFDYARGEGLFDPDKMLSGAFYNNQGLHSIVTKAEENEFEISDFLAKVLTTEMALRATNVSIK